MGNVTFVVTFVTTKTPHCNILLGEMAKDDEIGLFSIYMETFILYF